MSLIWSYQRGGNAMLQVMLKLKFVKVGFVSWNKETFGDAYVHIYNVQVCLQHVQDDISLLGFNEDRFRKAVET